jgi:hypothetical protein
VRTSVRHFGIIAATAGLMAIGSPAFADSADNDGVNTGNDLNTITTPTQTCSNSLASVTSILFYSPQSNQCVNSPLVDHPSSH